MFNSLSFLSQHVEVPQAHGLRQFWIRVCPYSTGISTGFPAWSSCRDHTSARTSQEKILAWPCSSVRITEYECSKEHLFLLGSALGTLSHVTGSINAYSVVVTTKWSNQGGICSKLELTSNVWPCTGYNCWQQSDYVMFLFCYCLDRRRVLYIYYVSDNNIAPW